MLRSSAQAAVRARAVAEPSRVTIGYTANLIVTPAVRELRHRHPDADVRTQHLAWHDARAVLLDHRVDAAVTRLPFSTGQPHVTVLYDEPRVLLVPVDHSSTPKPTSPVPARRAFLPGLDPRCGPH